MELSGLVAAASTTLYMVPSCVGAGRPVGRFPRPGKLSYGPGQGLAALDCGGSGKVVDSRNAQISGPSARPGRGRRWSMIAPSLAS